ncbi:MAG: arginyltransferase [Methylophaga sp.]|nr:MAG: arginyltransferase [Methylophaga sp.]
MSNTIQFYQDSIHPCSYIDGHQARNIYPDPHQLMTNLLYSHLIQQGFRRSSDLAYRPYCPTCQACIPVRINIKNFQPNRSQRRCLSNNKEISLSLHANEFNDQHFQLYGRYLANRHIGGGMDDPTKQSYINFLTSSWSETQLIEFKYHDKLVAVAVTDFIADGLSAFYTFFDPDLPKQSLGTFAILQQIELAKKHGFSQLYLGYWIKNCQKMQYKQNFSGVEAYVNQHWQPINTLKNFE